MPHSETKQRIIQRHLGNALLQAPALSAMQRAPGLDLSADQPTSPLDGEMVESAWRALEQGQTHYVDVPGIMPLREALAHHLAGMGLDGYLPASVLVAAGIQEARFLALQMIGDLFGKVGLPEVVHPGAAKAAGVRRLAVQTLPVDPDRGRLPTLDGMRAALRSGCKLLYLESPGRLTGAIYDSASLAEIATLIKEFQAGVIWDQGMAPWVAPGHYASLGAQPEMTARVALLGEAWPGLGLESLAVGYLAATEDWLEDIRSQKQIMAICTSTPSQYAAVAAPGVYEREHAGQYARLAAAREQAARRAEALGVTVLPGAAANVLALRPRKAAPIAGRLAAAGFHFADGTDFGAPGVIRLSVTFDDTIARALELLA